MKGRDKTVDQFILVGIGEDAWQFVLVDKRYNKHFVIINNVFFPIIFLSVKIIEN